MPALPSPGAVLKVEYKIGDNASIEAGSRFFLSYTGGPPNTTDLNTLASDIATHWVGVMDGVTNNAESLHGVDVTDLSSDSGAVGGWTGSHGGTLSGASLPASAAAVVVHAINRRYRGGKPRTYVRAGVDTSMNGTNQWSTTFAGDVTTAWQTWIAAILATSGLSITLSNIVNVSWYSGYTQYQTPGGKWKTVASLRATPKVDNIVDSNCATKIGSQRRRLNV